MHNSDLTLHVTSRGADRAALVGATGTGKSTFAEWWLSSFRGEYPKSRILVIDTKPRWRAEYLSDGTRAKRRYKRMAKGDTIPGSMALERPQDWALVWSPDVNPSQTVISQNLKLTKLQNVRYQAWIAERFFRTQDARRPSLIYFDEGMDFFSTSGTTAAGSDIVERCYRAGREMNLVTVFGSQRPISIPKLVMSECSHLACFALDNRADVKRLWDYGWPRTTMPPTRHDPNVCTEDCVQHDPDGTFRLWRKGFSAPKYRLALDEERTAA